MRMTRLSRVLLAAVLMAGALPLMGQVQPPAAPRPRASPADAVNAIVEGNYQSGKRLTIYYGRPNMKAANGGEARKIWGGLVPWGQVWRLGANEATLMITEGALQFGDVTVPANSAHSLYVLPVENGASKLIINKKIGQWGTVYDQSQDLGRVDLKHDELTQPVEQLTIAVQVNQGGGGGTLKILWDKSQYSAPFTVKK